MKEFTAADIDLSDPVIRKRYATPIASPPHRGHKPGNERSLKEFIATLENVRVKNEAATAALEKANSTSQPSEARLSRIEKENERLSEEVAELKTLIVEALK